MALSKRDRQGIAIIASALFAVVIAAIFSLQMKSQPHADASGCLPDVKGRTIILLDHSEGVPEQTAQEIKARAFAFLKDRTATYDEVRVYTVTDQSANALRPTFKGCKPPATGNALYQGVKSIKARFEKGFREPLEDLLNQKVGDSTTSPIAQAISDLSVSDAMKAGHTNLVIFSDMIENSPALNMYTCMASASPVAQFKAANVGAVQRPHFQNVTVVLNLIPRRGVKSDTLKCRDKFWPWFFGDNQGPKAALDLTYLPG